MNNSGTTKKCTKCGEEKLRIFFHKKRTKSDGLRPWCIACDSIYKKKYREDNRDILREKNKKYSELSRDKINEKSRRWRANNPEKIREINRKNYQANNEKLKTYRAKNKVKINDKIKKIISCECHSKFYLKNLAPTDGAIMEKGVIKVLCKFCGQYFLPKYLEVKSRSLSYRGMIGGENNFYCSDSCRSSCPIFGARSDHQDRRLAPPKSEKKKTRSCQTRSLKQLQCDDKGYTYCERCGDFMPELHHTIPVSENPSEAMNPAAHILLCVGCHVNLHKGCR